MKGLSSKRVPIRISLPSVSKEIEITQRLGIKTGVDSKGVGFRLDLDQALVVMVGNAKTGDAVATCKTLGNVVIGPEQAALCHAAIEHDDLRVVY